MGEPLQGLTGYLDDFPSLRGSWWERLHSGPTHIPEGEVFQIVLALLFHLAEFSDTMKNCMEFYFDHLKEKWSSFQVVPLFLKSFHFWVSYITF
jgi:hypothetical protein